MKVGLGHTDLGALILQCALDSSAWDLVKGAFFLLNTALARLSFAIMLGRLFPTPIQ